MTNCWLGFATFRFALLIAVMFAVRAPEAAGDLIELKQHTAPVHTIQWSADGKRLASACEDGVVCVWDADGKLVSKTQIEAIEHPMVSFTPDLTRIAVVRSKDSLSRRPVERNGGKTVVYSLPDGKKICRFNARTEPIRDYPFRASIFAVELSPDGTRLAVGGSVEAVGGRHGEPGGIATIWDVERAQIIRRSTRFSTTVISLVWTQDSDVLVIGTAGSGTELAEAGEIHAWHKNNWLPSGGKPARVFHTDFLDPLTVGKPGYADLVGVRDLRVVGDQLTALIQNADAEIVRKWDLMTGKSQSASTTEINWRSKLQLELSSGGTLVAAHKQDMAHIYNATTLKRITTVKVPSAVRYVGFDPQDTKVAIGTDKGTVQIHAVTR